VRKVGEYDVAFVGVPFDIGSTFRSGTRFGPQGMRRISALYQKYSYEHAIDLGETLAMCDAGDIFCPSNITKAHDQITKGVAHILSQGTLPMIMGGDHSIGYPCARGVAQCVDGKRGIIHIDRHVDTQHLPVVPRHQHPELPAGQPGAAGHRRPPESLRGGVWPYRRFILTTDLQPDGAAWARVESLAAALGALAARTLGFVPRVRTAWLPPHPADDGGAPHLSRVMNEEIAGGAVEVFVVPSAFELNVWQRTTLGQVLAESRRLRDTRDAETSKTGRGRWLGTEPLPRTFLEILIFGAPEIARELPERRRCEAGTPARDRCRRDPDDRNA
jgi:hypothetical protein